MEFLPLIISMYDKECEDWMLPVSC